MRNNVEHRHLRRPPGSTPLPNHGWKMDASAYFEWVERVKKDQIGFDPTLGRNGVILSEGIKHPNSGSGLSGRAESLYEG